MTQQVEDAELIIGDWHHRFTGVSATIATMLPEMADKERLAVLSGRESPYPRVGMWQAIQLCWRRPVEKPFRILHARRNIELWLGLLLRKVLRRPVRVVFTSAAKRRHSAVPRFLISTADVRIATTDEAASHLRDVAAVIPHGVNCQKFRPADDRTGVLRSFGIRQQKAAAIVGRIRPEKGTDLFVDAMIPVLQQRRDVAACLVGTATQKFAEFADDLKKRIHEAGVTDQVYWMNQLGHDDLARLLSGISMCVAPARYEGFGLVPLEAMACQAAVVASMTGAYPQIVVPEKTGLLVDCGDADGLSQAIARLLDDDTLRISMGQAGRQRVIDHYSAELESQRIREVYQNLWNKAA
ncbi:glycosyltransferase family 4 protein [Crateriforma conspicua]|uniref:Capsular glucan synthase n=1 Tax=Crateriforma conspicua TaxID=2527996 RepID=A0A5C5YBM7_9PLAN|nr:glycosyltransferase family 4 protein [Crateriforma conspicua]TWT72514.1 Capsular glucan synthase [Crateriforma conspicua]